MVTVRFQPVDNHYREFFRPDGSKATYNHDTLVRRTPDGRPDYSDPAYCPWCGARADVLARTRGKGRNMSGVGPRMRRALDTVPAFKANTIAGTQPTYQVNVNENYYPPLPSVLDAVREAAAGINRYPTMTNDALIEAIAERVEVPIDRIAVGGGGAAVLQQLLLATVEHGDEVVFPWLSFEAYPILSSVAGTHSVRVPLSGDDQDLRAVARAVSTVDENHVETGELLAADDAVLPGLGDPFPWDGTGRKPYSFPLG